MIDTLPAETWTILPLSVGTSTLAQRSLSLVFPVASGLLSHGAPAVMHTKCSQPSCCGLCSVQGSLGMLPKKEVVGWLTCLTAQGTLIIDPGGVHLAVCTQGYAVHASCSHLHHLRM